MTYWVDDIVVCHLKDGLIVSRHETSYDDSISLKIIGFQAGDNGVEDYVVFVPAYELARLNTPLVVSRHICKAYDINPMFLGEHMTYIRNLHIVDVSWRADGMWCQGKCGEFYQWAGPNQTDGTFTCRSCLQNPWR